MKDSEERERESKLPNAINTISDSIARPDEGEITTTTAAIIIIMLLRGRREDSGRSEMSHAE